MSWEAELAKAGLKGVGALVDLWLSRGLDPDEQARIEVQRIRSSDELRADAGTEEAWDLAKEEAAAETERFPRRTTTEPSMPAFTDIDLEED